MSTLTIHESLSDRVADYAELLADTDEFTVYVPASLRHGIPLDFFHYSRVVDGKTCYGTYENARHSFSGAGHSMPIQPSRLNGSSAHIGNTDNFPEESVERARVVASPRNWCPYNAEPTPEDRLRANAEQGVPQRFYRGAHLDNAQPWGIGTAYLPLEA